MPTNHVEEPLPTATKKRGRQTTSRLSLCYEQQSVWCDAGGWYRAASILTSAGMSYFGLAASNNKNNVNDTRLHHGRANVVFLVRGSNGIARCFEGNRTRANTPYDRPCVRCFPNSKQKTEDRNILNLSGESIKIQEFASARGSRHNEKQISSLSIGTDKGRTSQLDYSRKKKKKQNAVLR